MRIGDIDKAPATAAPAAGPTLGARMLAHLASPLGITLVVPGLVVVVGLTIALLGGHALRASNLAVARERLAVESRLVAASVDGALSEADPVLDRVADLARGRSSGDPFDTLAGALLDLAIARPGVTYASLSFRDGTFQGAYLDADGTWRFQDSRLGEGGTHVRRYDFVGRAIRLRSEETTTYDPRERSFYRDAVRAGAATWTDPYTFFGSHQTGITRTAPVMVDGALHAVVTVDFDVHALSSTLRDRNIPGSIALLYAPDGSILAHSGDDAMAAVAVDEARTLRAADFHDPVLDAFFARELDRTERVEELDVAGATYLAAITPTHDELGLGWCLVYLAPQERFLAALGAYERESLGLGLALVVLAMVVAILFATHVTRVRKDAEAARAEAALARKDARELGSYRLVTCLGKGGMGEVWRAEHRLLARDAAVKLIRPPESGTVTDELKTRFRREAQALAGLRSRSTIELFDFGISEGGTFFFVMELLDGIDLERLVEKHGAQPTARVVQFLAHALRSLSEAHDAGLVHRDIKPANLYLCREADEVDLLKVLDFGLVRVVQLPESTPGQDGMKSEAGLSARSKETLGQGSLGTPAFMPPEQSLGEPVDGRADLYALAGVAFWLLSGKNVYPLDDPFALMLAHLQDPLPDLRAALPPTVPDALVDLLRACLAKSPNDRPASARVMLETLRAIPIAEPWSDVHASAWWTKHAPPAPRPSVHPPPQ